MSTLIFVLIWVVLGLGLLLIALSGGPSGAGKRLMSTGRVARRVSIVLFAVLALVLGVLVPAAVIAAVSNRNDIPEANVTDLTASEQEGRELFGQRCANCHTLKAANAIASIGPNLDELRPPKALVLDAIENGRAQGNGQMAAGLFAGQEAEDVADFVSKAVGQTESGGGEGGSGGGDEGGAGGDSGSGGGGGASGEEGGGSGDESGSSG
jgi:mono/diheme cytochrome c family protein